MLVLFFKYFPLVIYLWKTKKSQHNSLTKNVIVLIVLIVCRGQDMGTCAACRSRIPVRTAVIVSVVMWCCLLNKFSFAGHITVVVLPAGRTSFGRAYFQLSKWHYLSNHLDKSYFYYDNILLVCFAFLLMLLLFYFGFYCAVDIWP